MKPEDIVALLFGFGVFMLCMSGSLFILVELFRACK